MVELSKFTRYLDLHNRYEAAEAAGVDSEAAYDELMEWVFRIRDSEAGRHPRSVLQSPERGAPRRAGPRLHLWRLERAAR